MSKRLRHAFVLVGAALLLAVPLYFGTVWAAGKLEPPQQALSMNEAYRSALEQARAWDKTAQLLTMTSVDLDRPAQYDGSNGKLPHWNLEFVSSNNALYAVAIRDGHVASAAQQGTGAYDQTVPSTSEAAWLDSPHFAELALKNGLRPYQGKWARGMNFVLSVVNGHSQVVVGGAAKDGLPAFFTFDAHDGTLLAGAERTISGGGLYVMPDDAHPVQELSGELVRLLPEPGNVPDNICALAATSNALFAGTDTRRDLRATERPQLLVSYDGGATWRSLPGPFEDTYAVEHIAVTPDGASLYVGSTAGLFYASGVREGQEIAWQVPQSGLPAGQITSLVLSPSFETDHSVWAAVGRPSIPSSLWGEPGSEGLFRSTDGGRSWEKLDSAPGEISDIALAPGSPQTLFVASGRMSLFRSTDGGQHWTRLPLETPGVGQIALSPSFDTDATLFVAANALGLWRSKDGGESWTLVTKDLTYPANAAVQLLVSPDFAQDRTVAYAAFRGGLVLSHDGGDTWLVFDLANLRGDGTPQDMAFLSNGRIAFSVYPLLGWQPLVVVRGKSGRPVSYPTPAADAQ